MILHKRRLCAVLSACVLFISLPGCGRFEPEMNGMVEVYYAVSVIEPSAKDASVARAVRMNPPDGADAMHFALGAMTDAPEDSTLHSVFPEGTQVLDIAVENGCAVVHLSEEWDAATGLNKTIAEYCMLKTGLQFEGVSAVRWETEQYTGAVLRGDSYIDTPLELVATRHEIKLYFSDASWLELVPETRPVVLWESESSEWYRLVVDALIAGPVTSEAVPVMPERTRRISVTMDMDSRVCIVNFSREFVNNAEGDTQQARMTLLALVQSLTELQGVSFVKIRVEGEDLPSYFGWDTSMPLERNDAALEIDNS